MHFCRCYFCLFKVMFLLSATVNSVNHHQTTMWENMFFTFSKHLKQIKESKFIYQVNIADEMWASSPSFFIPQSEKATLYALNAEIGLPFFLRLEKLIIHKSINLLRLGQVVFLFWQSTNLSNIQVQESITSNIPLEHTPDLNCLWRKWFHIGILGVCYVCLFFLNFLRKSVSFRLLAGRLT